MPDSFDPTLPLHRSFRQRHKSAFHEGGNLVGIAGAVALSAALLNPLPLLIGLVAEAAYLLFVPDTNWYTRRLEHRFDAEVVERREALKREVFPTVRPQVQEQFARLEQMHAQIGTQARREETWFREALRKLDFLMEKYLQFAAKESQFTNYLISVYEDIYEQLPNEIRKKSGKPDELRGVPPRLRDQFSNRNRDGETRVVMAEPTPDWVADLVGTIQTYYASEIETLGAESAAETVMANRNVMEKRQQILVRRREFVGRMGQILTNLGHQMRLMSDTFGLINDEIRARSPEQVLADIDEVVVQTASLTQALDEMTPTDELVGTLSQSA